MFFVTPPQTLNLADANTNTALSSRSPSTESASSASDTSYDPRRKLGGQDNPLVVRLTNREYSGKLRLGKHAIRVMNIIAQVVLARGRK